MYSFRRQERMGKMRKNAIRFTVNLTLLIFGTATVFSGMLIQLKYHIGNHGYTFENQAVMGLSYYEWSRIHKISIILLSILMIMHIYQHWNWYKAVVRKRLITKNIQVIILSLLFALVAITGFVPWLIDLLNGDDMLRKGIIEIHDKFALILLVFLILHIAKRLKRFFMLLKD